MRGGARRGAIRHSTRCSLAPSIAGIAQTAGGAVGVYTQNACALLARDHGQAGHHCRGLSHEGSPGPTIATVPSPLLSSQAGVYSRCTGMPTLCRGTRHQYLLWWPCFRQKKKNERITAGRTQGNPKEHIHGQGGRMSAVPFVCSGRTRLPPPPHACPPPCCDPALTRATALRQNVRPVFVFLRLKRPTTGIRQRPPGRI